MLYRAAVPKSPKRDRPAQLGDRVRQELNSLKSKDPSKTDKWFVDEVNKLDMVPGKKLTASNFHAFWSRGSAKSEWALPMAIVLNVSDAYLASGKGPKERPNVEVIARLSSGSKPRPASPVSDMALRLASLFDLMPVDHRIAAWPWLVRMLAKDEKIRRIYDLSKIPNERIEEMFGRVPQGVKTE